MIVSGNEILHLVARTKAQKESGNFDPQRVCCRPSIDIDPFDERMLNPHSYNLKLGQLLRVYRPGYELHVARERFPWHPYNPGALTPLDMAVENEVVDLAIPREGLVLQPGILYLGHTAERVAAWGLAPKIDGRSSVGRLGLLIHLTAGYGDSGFDGQYTLELSVIQPLRVYAGVPVCQISFEHIDGCVTDYVGKYAGQRGPVPSRLWKELVNRPPTEE